MCEPARVLIFEELAWRADLQCKRAQGLATFSKSVLPDKCEPFPCTTAMSPAGCDHQLRCLAARPPAYSADGRDGRRSHMLPTWAADRALRTSSTPRASTCSPLESGENTARRARTPARGARRPVVTPRARCRLQSGGCSSWAPGTSRAAVAPGNEVVGWRGVDGAR